MSRVVLKPLLADAIATLEAAGVGSPRFDAEELMASLLGIRRQMLFLTDDVTQVQADGFLTLIARRARREPLQHITGRAGFRHLELLVGKGVFIPRFETEDVAGAAIEEAGGLDEAGVHPIVVDLCSGSGAIALSVSNEVSGAEVIAVERDATAIFWLLRNMAKREALGDRPIRLVQGTIDGCLPELDGQVDIVVSNPPYVPRSVHSSLSVEVTEHDPDVAVFSGEDGLELMPTVIATAHRLLKPGGLLVVEHDDTQRDAMLELLAGWEDVEDHDDLNGRPRYSTARK